MRPPREALRDAPEVQALYSVGRLARVGNVDKDMLRRLLRSNGVTLYRGGRVFYVTLAEIQEKIPPLFQSLCLAEQLRRGAPT
jgi:hypothetical protein